MHRKRTQRDGLLLVLILVMLATFAVAIFPIAFSMAKTARHKEFVKDLTESCYQTRKSGAVAEWEEETFQISKDSVSDLYTLIMDAGMGKTQRKTPDESPLVIHFRDDAVLRLWEVEISEKSRQRDYGVFLQYQGANGKIYQYDTDKFGWSAVMNKLGL